jgi:hypothetical protein
MKGKYFLQKHETFLRIVPEKLELFGQENILWKIAQKLHISKICWQEMTGHVEIKSHLFATLGESNTKVTNTA